MERDESQVIAAFRRVRAAQRRRHAAKQALLAPDRDFTDPAIKAKVNAAQEEWTQARIEIMSLIWRDDATV